MAIPNPRIVVIEQTATPALLQVIGCGYEDPFQQLSLDLSGYHCSLLCQPTRVCGESGCAGAHCVSEAGRCRQTRGGQGLRYQERITCRCLV